MTLTRPCRTRPDHALHAPHDGPLGGTAHMRVKLFTLRYSATLGGFDDSPVQEFSRDKEMLSFREYFFPVNEVPHLACVVTYQEPVVGSDILSAAREITSNRSPRSSNSGKARGKRQDPSVGLSESERTLFNTLRIWRADEARTQGVPAYVILRNRDLVALVTKRPDSRTALLGISGIGPKTVERYGDAILHKLHGARGSQTATFRGNADAPDPTAGSTSAAVTTKAVTSADSVS